MSAAKLYTPDVLALATGLAESPLDESFPFQGEARSRSCGSAIALGLALDGDGRVTRVGVRSQACAMGQAAAALFAKGAAGKSGIEITQAAGALSAWLDGKGPMPAWPGLDAIAPVVGYPARHPAVMLAWKAAQNALFGADAPR